MAAFKKSLVVLAAVLVALAGASTANAQHPTGLMTCTATSVQPLVRAEGLADLTGDIIMTCVTASVGGPPQGSVITTNFTVTLNTNITSHIISSGGPTDAVLIINEQYTVNAGTSTFTPGSAMWGTLIANNTAQWAGVNVPVPAVGATTFIRISNIRANISGLGVVSGEQAFPTTQVTAFVSATGPSTVPITNNVLNVGVPFRGLAVRVRGGGARGTKDGPSQFSATGIVFLQCVGRRIDSDGNLVSAHTFTGIADPETVVGDLSIRLSEGFATAFKTLGFPTASQSNTQFESGFTWATYGTRFIIRVSNVPTGVRLAAPSLVTGTASGGHILTLVRVGDADSNGNSPGAGNSNPGPVPAGGTSNSTREFSISGGAGSATYEVTDCNPLATEFAVVPIYVGYTANTANDSPGTGTFRIGAAFAPTSTTTTASRGAAEPRFVDTSAPLTDIGQIVRCTTTLLFPFVTNRAGFNTGFALSNTSRDPFGTIAQQGTCTIYYYGGTEGGGAAPGNDTTAVIPSGQYISWNLAGGNAAADIVGAPGFEGYVIIVCQFQYAHAFAFISDGFGGIPTQAHGYLALVIPDPPSVTGVIGGGRPANSHSLAPAGTGEVLGN